MSKSEITTIMAKAASSAGKKVYIATIDKDKTARLISAAPDLLEALKRISQLEEELAKANESLEGSRAFILERTGQGGGPVY